jgi:lipopolysaccharide transport system permease protein
MLKEKAKEEWSVEITSSSSWFSVRLSDIWAYRDLLILLIKRDIVTIYQQTVLGIFWYFIPPLLTTFIYVLIFNMFARIPTQDSPSILFYLSGIVIWGFFSESFSRLSGTFTSNSSIFGKVYFPRIIVPISVIVSSMFKFGLQCILFLGFYLYYLLATNSLQVVPLSFLLLPLVILILALISMGAGLIVSSLTTKYRDFSFLIAFGLQLLMYASPVIYPTSFIPAKYRIIMYLNPLTSVIETFRNIFIHPELIPWTGLLYSGIFGICIFLAGLSIFSRVEKSFMDTI